MLKENKLHNLYEGLIQGDELTTKVLNSYGFNSKDLANLIEEGVLKRIKRGYYSFLAIDDFYLYGKKLIADKDYNKATKCFERSYALNPHHGGACFQLFLRSIHKKDYEEAFKYFEVIFNTNNVYYKKDSNFYLYLLSIITEVPDKYKEYARNLKCEDICIDIDDKRYRNKPLRNKIRKSIFKNKFPFAMKQMNDLISANNQIIVQDIISQALLYQATEVETQKKHKIINFINNKEYDQLISFFTETENKHKLSVYDEYTLWLAKNILNIKETNEIPKIKKLQAQNIFHAIDCENYELALQMCETFNLKNNIDNSKSAIYLLLSDTCNLIQNISNHNISNNSNSIISKKTAINENEQPELISNTNSDTLFSKLTKELSELDMDNAANTLKQYMQSINKSEYEFLVLNLIKLSLIEQNITFTKPFIVLSDLTKDSFEFEPSSYVDEFYAALKENKIAQARIYLDIICNINKIDKNYVLADSLLQALNSNDNNVQYEHSKSISPINTIDYDAVSLILEDKQKNSMLEQEHAITEISFENTEEENSKNTDVRSRRDSEDKFVENKYNLLLKNKGMILLKPMNKERRDHIHNMVERYPDMDSFSIGEGKKRQVVLRYAPFIKEDIDTKALKEAGNQAYFEKKYNSCIENYLQVLQVESRGHVYARLGLAYMKKGKINLAIDYLTVATYVSRQGNKRFDFTDLLASLTGDVDKEETKSRVKMFETDFNRSIDNYGIENIDQITTFINETGLDVESACEHFGMNEEQLDTVRLIYARDYYSQGHYEKGDEFLKSVEQSKHKTKSTTELFSEIQKNKKFYINRSQETPRQLKLTMKPKKHQKIKTL